jgi:hypothetical protein
VSANVIVMRTPRTLPAYRTPEAQEPALTSPAERVISFDEAADIAGKRPRTIVQWVQAKKLQGVRDGAGGVGVCESALRRFLEHLAATDRRSVGPLPDPSTAQRQLALRFNDDDDGTP